MKVYTGKPGNMRVVHRQLKTRKTVRKHKIYCSDWPLKGEWLYLSDNATAVFTINGQRGRYINGDWEQC